jgi:hypothetical protein
MEGPLEKQGMSYKVTEVLQEFEAVVISHSDERCGLHRGGVGFPAILHMVPSDDC